MPAQATRRLEINEDPLFQQRDWRIQRVGWGVLAAIIAAALAGLLGAGPLSKTHVRGGTSLEVEYQRFLRHGAESELRVTVAEQERARRHVRVAISRKYLGDLDLQRVTPAPVRVQSTAHAVIYVFERLPGPGPLQAKFVFKPDEVGSHSGGIAIDDGSRVPIRQFTYP